MSEFSQQLFATDSAIISIDSRFPDYNDHTSPYAMFYQPYPNPTSLVMCYKYDELPSEMYKYRLASVNFYANLLKGKTAQEPYTYCDYVSASFRSIETEWDEETVTYAQLKDHTYGYIGGDNVTFYIGTSNAKLLDYDRLTQYINLEKILDSPQVVESFRRVLLGALQYGNIVGLAGGSPNQYIRSEFSTTHRESGGNLSSYIIFVFDGDENEDYYNKLEYKSLTPSSGYIPKGKVNKFNWATQQIGLSITKCVPTAYTLEWRYGDSGTVTSIDCGSDATYTFPANTFSEDEVQWRVITTDNFDQTVTSEWQTLSTAETTSTPETIEPKNNIYDGSKGILFRWYHRIATGTAQTQADLQYSNDLENWSDLVTIVGADNTYTAPARTFTSGNWYWRVRTYNTDGTASAWTEPTSFTAISSPTVPQLRVTEEPKPTITWDSMEQQGYEITVDGATLGIKYGYDSKMKLPDYLTDGGHTIAVRVQNIYGLWSDPATATISVANDAGADIPLTLLNENNAAHILWQDTENEYSEFIVYRDNVPIAKQTGNDYFDELTSGNHAYKVRGIYSDSTNYGLSEEKTIKVTPKRSLITDLNDIDWIDITESLSSLRSISASISLSGNFAHYAGADFPTYEKTRYKDLSIQCETAFKDISKAEKFETLIGKMVCLKTQNGDFAIGVLDGVSRQRNQFTIGYTFNIRKTAWNEAVET